ncbi:hypothetical protein [Parasegetibacter sp. NRK P23]|uniref:hypothetical protein n=1 Tax=Parasegetibacter sp. NRK P23 TaxID=2942999 RepID=UPI002042FB67|nr:hypothetical protein [Parasegetibacter sp. NRK P23]MCM5528964.1 hypothetical protein [Parasegetibacter sp. NRK P23]
MKNFKYIGQQQHNSTIEVKKEGRIVHEDLRLSPGKSYMLNEDHPVVKSLIATGLLVDQAPGVSGKQKAITEKR